MLLKDDPMKNYLIILCLILFPLLGKSQYSPQFSQLIKTLEFINPGYNASKTDPSAILLYRNQWTGFNGAPKSYGVNLNYPVNKWHTGFGLNSLVETRGITTQTDIALNGNVDVKISNKSFLTFGLNGGLETRRFDLSHAVYADTDPITADDLNTNSFYTAIGINFFSGNLHLGGSLHYTQSQETQYYWSGGCSYYFNASYLVNLSKDWILKPSFLYRNFAGYNSLDYGVFILYEDLFWLGIANRWDQALIFFADIKINKYLRLGYSYDLGAGSSGIAKYGSHEISLEFSLPRAVSAFDRFAN